MPDIYDLIGSGYQARNHILKLFPTAKVEDASDDIHRERFSVSLDGYSIQVYLLRIIQHGFAHVSMHCQMMFMDRDDCPPWFPEIVREAIANTKIKDEILAEIC